MKSELELHSDLLFKERELLSLTSHIETERRKLQKLEVEYQRVEGEFRKLSYDYEHRPAKNDI